MFLHHISSCSLIAAYVLANIHCLGAGVAVMHDAADIFANLARIWQPTKYLKASFLLFAVMMVIWVWTRLLLLPYFIWVLQFKTIPVL